MGQMEPTKQQQITHPMELMEIPTIPTSDQVRTILMVRLQSTARYIQIHMEQT
jgi:hypothetical protein